MSKVSVRQNNSSVQQGKGKPVRVRLSRKPVQDIRNSIIDIAKRNPNRKAKPMSLALLCAAYSRI